MLVVVPTIQKILDTSIQRISSLLDSKKNNWVSWSTSMRNLFEMNDCTEYINTTLQCPDPKIDPKGAKNWHWNNNYAKFLIDHNTTEEEKLTTQGCDTASEMWVNLRAQYESKDSLVYTDLLQTIYMTRATEGSNIVDHLAKIKKYWDQLGHMMYSKCSVLENDIAFK